MFDLWQDPQERYDIFMNNFTERTWMGVVMGEEMKKIMATYVQYPPRKPQSLTYNGPLTLSDYERFQWVRELAGKGGREPSDADWQLICARRPEFGPPATFTMSKGSFGHALGQRSPAMDPPAILEDVA